MSEVRDENDHRRGRYLLSGDSTFDSEELANACRRLGITGPLEPLLRELKIKDGPATPIKDSPRKSQQKKEKKSTGRCQRDYSTADFDGNLQSSTNKTSGGKNSYGQESWGRDSGARDLSPEPHRVTDSLGTDSQLTENETGGTSSMLHLASKVS